MNKLLPKVFIVWCSWGYCMEKDLDDFSLKVIEEGRAANATEKSPEQKQKKSLAQEHVEIRETINAVNANFVYLNSQLHTTNGNIVALNALTEKVNQSERNIMKIHSELYTGAGGLALCLFCCIVLPIWIVLGYVVTR